MMWVLLPFLLSVGSTGSAGLEDDAMSPISAVDMVFDPANDRLGLEIQRHTGVVVAVDVVTGASEATAPGPLGSRGMSPVLILLSRCFVRSA